MPTPSEPVPSQFAPFPALFVHLWWLIVGHVSVFFAAFAMYANHLSSSAVANAVFVALAVLPLIARWADFHFYDGETAEGAPTTKAHCVRYCVKSVILYAAVWIVFQLLSRYAPL
jgi:hypothetical protein